MQNYLDTAVDIAAAAGEIMMKYFDIGVPAHWKEDNTPITVADGAINDMVIDRIAAEYPDHGVVGEEASIVKPESAYQWVCDPIDGTVPFMLGIPTNVFSLALCENGAPIVAVVADPYLQRPGRGIPWGRFGEDGTVEHTRRNLDDLVDHRVVM